MLLLENGLLIKKISLDRWWFTHAYSSVSLRLDRSSSRIAKATHRNHVLTSPSKQSKTPPPKKPNQTKRTCRTISLEVERKTSGWASCESCQLEGDGIVRKSCLLSQGQQWMSVRSCRNDGEEVSRKNKEKAQNVRANILRILAKR